MDNNSSTSIVCVQLFTFVYVLFFGYIHPFIQPVNQQWPVNPLDRRDQFVSSICIPLYILFPMSVVFRSGTQVVVQFVVSIGSSLSTVICTSLSLFRIFLFLKRSSCPHPLFSPSCMCIWQHPTVSLTLDYCFGYCSGGCARFSLGIMIRPVQIPQSTFHLFVVVVVYQFDLSLPLSLLIVFYRFL